MNQPIKSKSLNKKIMLSISLIALTTFILVGLIFNHFSKNIIIDSTYSKLSMEAKLASSEINEFLSNSKVLVEQMTTNEQFISYINSVKTREETKIHPLYKDVVASLARIKKTNDNLALVWLVPRKSSYLVTDDEWDSPLTFVVEERPWFKTLLEKRSVFFTEPYLDTVTGKMVLSVVAPIFDEKNEISGAVAIDLMLDQLPSILNNIKIGESGYVFLINKEGDFLFYNNDEEMLDKNIMEISEDIGNKMIIGETGTGQLSLDDETKFIGYSNIPSSGWSVGAVINEKEFMNQISFMNSIVFAVCLIGILLFAIFSLRISLSITKPLRKAIEQCNEIEKGNITYIIDDKYVKRKDEIGILAHAFKGMTSNIQMQADHAKNIAEGNLSIIVDPKSDEDVLNISLNQIIYELRRLTEESNMISQAAIEGNLKVRGDADKFKGGYFDIISGMNKTLDAISKPLEVGIEFIIGLADGTQMEYIPDADNYKGYYGELITNLNSVLESLLGMLNEVSNLTRGSLEGNLKSRADISKLMVDMQKLLKV